MNRLLQTIRHEVYNQYRNIVITAGGVRRDNGDHLYGQVAQWRIRPRFLE